MNEKRFRITLQERSFDIEVLDDPNLPEIRVRVNGKIWPVTVEDLSQATVSEPSCPLGSTAPTAAASEALEGSDGEKKGRQAVIVRAPLPGMITAIYVEADQPVYSGQDLCLPAVGSRVRGPARRDRRHHRAGGALQFRRGVLATSEIGVGGSGTAAQEFGIPTHPLSVASRAP